jgi:hypothetical protein
VVGLMAAGRGLRDLARAGRMAMKARGVEPRLLWILGSARSGTTWLANLLGSLTDATIVDEPLIGAHLAVPVGAIISLPAADESLVLDTNAGRPAYFFSDGSRPVWQPALRRLLLQRFATAANAAGPIIVKEPNGALAAPTLMRTLPRSRLLFVVRDGRDVLDSMVDGTTGGWISETHGASLAAADRRDFLERRARHWVRTVDAVQAAYDAHDSALRFRTTYEQLLADPIGAMTRLVAWSGHSATPARVRQAVDTFSFENVPAAAKGEGRFARAATPGLWRDHFSAEEQQLLTDVMGTRLTALGYE